MKTADIVKTIESSGYAMRREQYVIRAETRPGWQGRPKPHLVCGHRWSVHHIATGKPIVSRPTPAQVWSWWQAHPEVRAAIEGGDK